VTNEKTCPKRGTLKFCSKCGAKLSEKTQEIACPKWRTLNSWDASFCRNCGKKFGVEYAIWYIESEHAYSTLL